MENDRRLVRVAAPAVASSLVSAECWLQETQSSPPHRHPLHHIMMDRLSSGVWLLVYGMRIPHILRKETNIFIYKCCTLANPLETTLQTLCIDVTKIWITQ